MPEGLYHPIHTDEPFTLGDIDIHPLRFHMMRTNRQDTGWSAEQSPLLLQQISASMIRIQ